MLDKLQIIWLKIRNFLLWALLAALCAFIGYMIYTHRKLIAAMVLGVEPPESEGSKWCPCFWNK